MQHKAQGEGVNRLQDIEPEEKQQISQDMLNQLADELDCAILILKGVFFDGDQETLHLLGVVRSKADELKRWDKLCVLVDSGGGQLEPFFRILKVIRQNVSTLDALVPRHAKSAATFFCLGADEILMGPDGELGPLDPQVQDPSGGTRPISPLETFRALDELKNYCLDASLDTLNFVVDHLMRNNYMDRPYAMEQAMRMVSAIAGSIYSRVDMHELGQMGRYLSISETYAQLVMRRWSYKDLTEAQRRIIVYRLVHRYPTHDFVIDLQEAQEIRLHAKPLSTLYSELCERLLERLDTFDESAVIGFPRRNPDKDDGNIMVKEDAIEGSDAKIEQ